MRELGRGFGMALQLVNILRDTGADLAAGRCYFPADELAAAGVAPEDILNDPARLEVVWRRWHAHAQDGHRAWHALRRRRQQPPGARRQRDAGIARGADAGVDAIGRPATPAAQGEGAAPRGPHHDGPPRLHACRSRGAAIVLCPPAMGQSLSHDTARVRTGKGRRVGKQLLLRLPLPAQAAPRRHHGFLCLLPRGGRRGRRSQRSGRGANQARLVAGRGGEVVPRRAQPSGDEGADALHGRLRHRGAAAAGGDRRLPDGPGADPLPRLRRPGALLPPGGRHRRRSRGPHLRPDRSAAPRSTRTSWAWHSSSPTSSATSARTRCAGASTCP